MGLKLMIIYVLISYVSCQEDKPNIVLLFADDVRIFISSELCGVHVLHTCSFVFVWCGIDVTMNCVLR